MSDRFLNSLRSSIPKLEAIISKHDGAPFKFRQYQIDAYHFLWKCFLYDHGILLNLEPGLGKTIIYSSFLYSVVHDLVNYCDYPHLVSLVKEYGKTAIIFSPVPIIKRVWYRELMRLFDESEVSIYHGSSKPDLRKERGNVVLTTLETIHSVLENGSSSVFNNIRFLFGAIDEAHILRNGLKFTALQTVCERKKGRARSIYDYKDVHIRIGTTVTGTPLMNNTSDLVGMVRFNIPSQGRAPLNASEFAGSSARSTRWWILDNWANLDNMDSKADKVKKIATMSKSFMFQLDNDTTQLQLPVLPPCVELIRKVGLSSVQKEKTAATLKLLSNLLKAKILEQMAAGESDAMAILEYKEPNGEDDLMAKIFASLLRLRQISNCASLPEMRQQINEGAMDFDDLNAEQILERDSEKYKVMMQDIKEDIEEYRTRKGYRLRMMISTFWLCSLEAIRTCLYHSFGSSIDILCYHGEMTESDCKAVLDDFTSPSDAGGGRFSKPIILICTLSKVAVGLDLSVASELKIVEPFYNPALEHQLIKRLHRPGQKHPVRAVRYLTESFIELNTDEASNVDSVERSESAECIPSVDEFIRQLQLFKTRNIVELLHFDFKSDSASSKQAQYNQKAAKGIFSAETCRQLEAWDGQSRPTMHSLVEAFMRKKDRDAVKCAKESKDRRRIEKLKRKREMKQLGSSVNNILMIPLGGAPPRSGHS